jgi:hypothetical protein
VSKQQDANNNLQQSQATADWVWTYDCREQSLPRQLDDGIVLRLLQDLHPHLIIAREQK